ncbi:MAG: hypothetical protein MUF19_01565 [Candidatus Pacebacteria bacterium]|jgi:hypothetical protein|nr:hypothetical protein [Candidatus Paceibacterota bacterium]
MRFLLAVLVLALPTLAQAYFLTEHTLEVPYEVLILEQPITERQLVAGELEGYPEMIEFTTDTETTLRVSLLGLAGSTTPNFGGIVVRVREPRGVEEVVRLKPADATWESVREPVSKLSFLLGPEFETTIASGTYRVEVSTPENFGKYLIVLGEEDVHHGYGATWSAVSTLYEFAGVTKLGMVRTSLVYVPLLILLILGGFGYTIYRTRDRLPFLKQHA